MNASRFIAGKLRFQGKAAVVIIAVAVFVIIISSAVSAGFRRELRDGIASVSGDIQLTAPDLNYVGEQDPIRRDPEYLEQIRSIEGVRTIVPAVYRAGIVKSGENIHGVIFKGVPGGGDSLAVSVPVRLSKLLGVAPGDKLPAYFIGEKVKVRNFTIASTYEDVPGGDDAMVVFAGLSDMQRLNGWGEDDVSAIEIILEDKWRSAARMTGISAEVSARILFGTPEDEDTPVAVTALRKYPQIFSWLELIDFNVLFVLSLMTVVAGFNMISALLILLFRKISLIGTLKSMGMRDGAIASMFLRVASSAVIKGMACGNAAALLLCFVQGATHFLKLNPENYFVSFVPVRINVLQVLALDCLSYLAIMLLLLPPCFFVSNIDPAKTVRAQ